VKNYVIVNLKVVHHNGAFTHKHLAHYIAVLNPALVVNAWHVFSALSFVLLRGKKPHDWSISIREVFDSRQIDSLIINSIRNRSEGLIFNE
jgi:hypothetical protein